MTDPTECEHGVPHHRNCDACDIDAAKREASARPVGHIEHDSLINNVRWAPEATQLPDGAPLFAGSPDADLYRRRYEWAKSNPVLLQRIIDEWHPGRAHGLSRWIDAQIDMRIDPGARGGY